MLTFVESAKLSRNALVKGVMLGVATVDELLSQMPMVGKQGEAFKYNRELALPDPAFVDPGDNISEGSATFDEVKVALRIIGHHVDVDDFLDDQMSETNPQRAVQVEKVLKAVGRKIGQKLITGSFATSAAISPAMAGVSAPVAGPNQDTTRHGPGSIRYNNTNDTLEYRGPGDIEYGTPVNVAAAATYTLSSSNPNKKLTITSAGTASLPAADTESLVRIASTTKEWDGLQKLTPSSQTIASTGANGDQLSLPLMDRMIDEYVKVRENLVFVMHGKLKAKFYAAVRALGGANIEVTTLPGVNGQVPSYRGIPILQSDFIPTTESKGGSGNTLTSLYLVSLSEEGFHLAFGTGGNPQAPNLDIDPRSARVMGIRIKDIGDLEAKDSKRTRVTFYGATALGSELAVCRASELITAP